MANPDLSQQATRSLIISEIKNYENEERKRCSLKDYEVYNDRIKKYVYDQLVLQLGAKTCDQMPIVANLNIAKRIVDKRGSIYNTPPERSYTDILESDIETLEKVYADFMFDSILGKANKYYCLRNQAFIQILPQEQKLKLRLIQNHNIDVIPDENDPEKAYAYIINSFDKSQWIRSDSTNLTIADKDDYKAKAEIYQAWTADFIYTFSGKGQLLSEPVENPIKMLPFVDISKDKDFEFYVRLGQALSDFTIEFNVNWSDVMYASRMQGYSVGVLSGDPNLKPDSMTVGPAKYLFLPKNPDKPESGLEFDFKSPTPNIEASLKALEALIMTFLSTRGADVKSIQVTSGGASSYSSALERLLALIEQFEATKEDFDLFKMVEGKVHKVVTAWLSVLSGTQDLDREYWTAKTINNSKIKVKFHEPQMLETKAEMLSNAEKEINLGLEDNVSIYSKMHNVSIEAAQEKIDEIQSRKINTLASEVVNSGETIES